jgi:DNA (cytosine-5)-methyltransferase 1
VSQVKIKPQIPILSFFTGGGFLDLGFEKEGFKTVWYNEFNEDFADMFQHAMTGLRKGENPNAEEVTVSSKVSIEDLRAGLVQFEAFDGPPPECFGVIGGPPCPDFSSGGKHRGHDGDHGKLSQTYIDMVCSLRPAFFLMENVPGLIRHRKHRAYFESLRAQLHNAEYVTDFITLDALGFGAPQHRKRVFLIGVSQNMWRKVRPGSTLPTADGWFPFPKPYFENALNYPWPSMSRFGAAPVCPKNIPEELMTIHWLKDVGIDSGMPNSDEFFVPYSEKFKTVFEGDDSRKSFKRLHRYRYSPTACYGNNEVHLHPWEPRRLSVREALRIQTVPDEYILPDGKTLSAKFKMIANGVPVVLARAIAKSLMDFLTGSTASVEELSPSNRVSR